MEANRSAVSRGLRDGRTVDVHVTRVSGNLADACCDDMVVSGTARKFADTLGAYAKVARVSLIVFNCSEHEGLRASAVAGNISGGPTARDDAARVSRNVYVEGRRHYVVSGIPRDRHVPRERNDRIVSLAGDHFIVRRRVIHALGIAEERSAGVRQ